MTSENARSLEEAIEFTKTCQDYESSHPAVREARCLAVQFRHAFGPIEDGDLIAGRFRQRFMLAGFDEPTPGSCVGYRCVPERIQSLIESTDADGASRKALAGLMEFWEAHSTASVALARVKRMHPVPIPGLRSIYDRSPQDKDAERWRDRVGEYAFRWSSTNVDFQKLLKIGLGGLRREIERLKSSAVADERREAEGLYEGMFLALDALEEVRLGYQRQAERLAEACQERKRKDELARMAASLRNLRSEAPGTFHEAVQLVWLYSMAGKVRNLGRMDMHLGPFLAADLSFGRTSEEEAQRLVTSWWRMMGSAFNAYEGRVVLGGVGRPDPEAADRFAMLALEATRQVRAILPQTTLRVSRETSRMVWEKALSCIGEGGVFPILFNDETNVPAVASSLGVSEEEARQYVPSDCGEFSIEHRTVSSPNSTICVAKTLELALFNGVHPLSGERMGPETGDFAKFGSFDELWEALALQIDCAMGPLSEAQAALYPVLDETAPHVFWSMLYDDCLSRGKGVFGGGAVKRGILTESFGNITVSDSLVAIQDLVYARRLIEPSRLLEALKRNFQGYESERQMLLNAPKFGNDHPAADAMAVKFHHLVCSIAARHAARLGLDFSLLDLINSGGHVNIGKLVGATPDGRLAGAPMTNGDNPSIGSDRNGTTALIQSLAKLDTRQIGGQTCYLKFSRRLFKECRDKADSLLKSFFSLGGSSAMVTVVGKDELREAMLRPEAHGSLIVRVGGFNAKFVELPRELQEEIAARTLQ